MDGLELVKLSARDYLHTPLVSPKALGALASSLKGRDLDGGLWLQLLGLGDEHCVALAQALVGRRGVSHTLLLRYNAISEVGYRALLYAMNCAPVVRWIQVDDCQWQAEFQLVVELNRVRRPHLERGVFSSKTCWIQSLEALTTSRRNVADSNHVNYLWYSLRENPAFVK